LLGSDGEKSSVQLLRRLYPSFLHAASIDAPAVAPEDTAMHSLALDPKAVVKPHTTDELPPRLLRLPLVEERTSLKKSSIYAAIRAGTFPAPVRLSALAVAWRESDVNAWIESRSAA